MIRSAALVLLAPLVVLGLGLAFVWQAIEATRDARGLEARVMAALARPMAEPVTRGAALLIPGETAGLAGSAFQAAVLALTSASGVEVVQVESAPVEPASPLARLHLTLRLRGSEAQVVATLQAIERSTPLIRIDRLDLQGEGQENGILSASLALVAWSAEVRP